MRRITAGQVPAVREAILRAQGYRCPLCGGSLKSTAKKSPALDHDHRTGYLRGVLCVNCNGLEGKVFNLARRAGSGQETAWLRNLLDYYTTHETPQHGGIFHHTHRTAEEQRLERNKKARLRRQRLKASNA